MGLKREILRTIEYAARYGQKLTGLQVYKRLLGRKRRRKTEVLELAGLENKQKIKNQEYKRKMKLAKEMVERLMKEFEEIYFVGVTGSVAAGKPEADDDIDLMIITKANCLWKSRLIIRWYIWKNRIPHRVYGKEQKKDDFCFNMWLDEEGMLIPKGKRNEKNAVDLVLMKKVGNKKMTYEKFIMINKWTSKWAATPYNRLVKKIKGRIELNKSKKKEFSLINEFYYWPQRWWMRGKIRREVVNKHQAFFHKN